MYLFAWEYKHRKWFGRNISLIRNINMNLSDHELKKSCVFDYRKFNYFFALSVSRLKEKRDMITSEDDDVKRLKHIFVTLCVAWWGWANYLYLSKIKYTEGHRIIKPTKIDFFTTKISGRFIRNLLMAAKIAFYDRKCKDGLNIARSNFKIVC